MTIDRKLEEIVANLDDMSVTIEEIKDRGDASGSTETLEALREEMTRTADVIEEALESEPRGVTK